MKAVLQIRGGNLGQLVLNLLGLVMIAFGVSMWSVPAGVIVGGVFCFVFEIRIQDALNDQGRH